MSKPCRYLNIFYQLSLGMKTRILIAVTALGILIIGFIATLTLYGMKNSFDNSFHLRTLSIARLQTIKDVHTLNILNTYRDIIDNHTDVEKTYEVLNILKKNLDLRWNEYSLSRHDIQTNFFDTMDETILSTFLTPIPNTIMIDEDEIYSKANLNIQRLLKTIDTITVLYKNNQRPQADALIKSDLYPILDTTNIYLEQLTAFHLQRSIYEKEKTDRLFGATSWVIFVMIFVVLGISVFLAYFILEHIKTLHQSLEDRVRDKTKELVDLNTSLELRITHEIRQSRLKDEMLHQQAKLASMGEMISNIAHQWRQPLNALTILIQTFRLKSRSNKLTPEFIDSQVTEGLRIANTMSDTIESFQNYFKPNKVKTIFPLLETIRHAVSLIEGILHHANIDVEFNTKKEIMISGYPNDFTQIIINLLNNAKDALLISPDKLKMIRIHITHKPEKSLLLIRIIDNGGGIPSSVLKRIFEPYFTTKHQSSGTGIGLYMTQKIIADQFEGMISAQNIRLLFNETYYNCASFKITIPLFEIESKT
ncbi:MAG: HAMP domain-containing histidine kinase [Sulfuricurvum sp.]|uniref:sensor histidine kinase n=1 Tax=Sulfuricurvum sp. TaxID=2025608 RepID=UPI0025D18B63|nr:HAMP domain-containing sensor histidine kinase [Sulfuricurvum sp.]MBV5320665.1 HAMP domain-containing histidine kinase [Sulfuricurvum sp.]